MLVTRNPLVVSINVRRNCWWRAFLASSILLDGVNRRSSSFDAIFSRQKKFEYISRVFIIEMTYTWPFRLGGSVLLCTSRVNGSNYRYDELVVIRDLIYWVMILFFLLSFSFRACQLEKKKYFGKNFLSHIILSKWQVARATQPFRNTIRIEQRLHSSWWSTLTPIWSSPEDLACSLYWECGVCWGASMCCHWFGHRVDKWPKKRKRPNTHKKKGLANSPHPRHFFLSMVNMSTGEGSIHFWWRVCYLTLRPSGPLYLVYPLPLRAS